MNAPAERWSGPVRESSGRGVSVKTLANFIVGTLISLALLAAAGFFYLAIQRDEMMTAQCMRAVEAIRATQVLASQWSVEVGKVKNEVNSNFDVLANFIGRMEPHIETIQNSQKGLPNLPSDIKWALNGYIQRLKAREERIERFKSGFAIVRNSRRFIPREGEVLAEAARDGGYGKVEAATLQIMKGVQDFLRQPTEVQGQRMEQAMRTLADHASTTPLRTQADTLNKHVAALLRHHALTEQRFQDTMRTNLEDRADEVIGLLDADHQQSRTKRRYFDYGFWLFLGVIVLYWGTLLLRWKNKRRQGRTDAETLQATPAGGGAPWGMEAALATAGGDGSGVAVENGRASGQAGADDRLAQAALTRRMHRPRATAQFRTGPTLEERLRTREETETRRPMRREESVRQDARVNGSAATQGQVAPAGGDGQAGGHTEATLEERLRAREEEARWAALREGTEAKQPSATSASGKREDAGGDAGPGLEERLAALKAELEARRVQQRTGTEPEGVQVKGDIPTVGQDAPARQDGGEASAGERPIRTVEPPPETPAGLFRQAPRGGPAHEDHGEQGAVFTEDTAATAVQDTPAGKDRDITTRAGMFAPEAAIPPVGSTPVSRPTSSMEERLKALMAEVDAQPAEGMVTSGERTRAHGDGGMDLSPAMAKDEAAPAGRIPSESPAPQEQVRAEAAEPESESATLRVHAGQPEAGAPDAASVRPIATSGEYRMREREARDHAPVPAPDGTQERDGGEASAHAGESEGTPVVVQPDGSAFIHRATREAVLDRLQEVEQEIRAAVDAAEQAERARNNGDGEEEYQDAWAAAAGRMAGARWAVRTLLKEVDRLPAARVPREALPVPVDMKSLLERHLSVLAGEDRKRIDATLVPGAVTRGNRQALETAMQLIVQHALEGARLHPDGEGYVTLALVAEDDGVHLTCLDHGPESEGTGEHRNLALAVAQGLIEGQGGEMETVPYPRHGTMVRIRLLPA